MTEVIERVVLAIFNAIGETALDGNCHALQGGRIYFDGDFDAAAVARAAIEAMREPTRPMLKAACSALSPANRPTPTRVSVKAKHRIRYQAMISAALSPLQPQSEEPNSSSVADSGVRPSARTAAQHSAGGED